MESLLQGKLFESLKVQYYQDQKDTNPIDNTVKLLMRCYKIYQAREDVMRIMRMLEKREKLVQAEDCLANY